MLRDALSLARGAAIAAALAVPATGALAADVTIGIADWPSARATAHLLGTVIEDRLGLEVGYVEGTAAELFERMDAGEVDLFPEAWMPNHRPLVARYAERRGTIELIARGIPAEQGLCTTRHAADALGIRSVFDLKKPEVIAALDTDADSKGEMWIGAPGWASTKLERVRANSYGYGANMELMVSDERTALAAVDVAVAVDRPLVFYCYEPHHLFALHDIVRLDEPPHDPRSWNIRSEDEPNWLERSEAGSAYGLSFIHPVVRKDLSETLPQVLALVEGLDLDADTLSEMSYAIVVERQDPAAFARAWAERNTDRIGRWTE